MALVKCLVWRNVVHLRVQYQDGMRGKEGVRRG